MNSTLSQILVHFDGTARSSVRLAAARRLAKAHGSSIAVLHAVTPIYMRTPFVGNGGPGAVRALQEADADQLAMARHRFDEEMREPGPQASWTSADYAVPAEGFARQALFADLVVLGQHDGADANSQGVPPEFAESVMMASGTPGLIVPFVGAMPEAFRTIAIAWNASREAARAVHAALPLLKAATEVVVVGSKPPAPAEMTGPRLDLETWLAAHGVRNRWQWLGDDQPARPGEMLLSRAADVSADLLVMGCYGHSRMREWVLGGATRTVLQSMTLPVLMAH